jgi:plastocyanin
MIAAIPVTVFTIHLGKGKRTFFPQRVASTMPRLGRGARALRTVTMCAFLAMARQAFLPAALPVARAADTVEVMGHITLPEGRGPGRWAAVWLQGSAHAAPLRHAAIDQRDKTFLPHVLVVTTGTTVQFPNSDTVFHNVFAYFEAKRFDLGMYPRGATRSVTFEKPGVVSVLCNVHPQMSAFIVIVDTPYYTVAARNGDFHIKGVPPGTYTLHAWHESGASLTQQVSVGTGAPALALTLERH